MHTKPRVTDKGPSLQNNPGCGFCKARKFREYQKQKYDLSMKEWHKTTTVIPLLLVSLLQTYPLLLMLHSDLKALIPDFDTPFLKCAIILESSSFLKHEPSFTVLKECLSLCFKWDNNYRYVFSNSIKDSANIGYDFYVSIVQLSLISKHV